jgi:hypothetical protein
MRVVNGGIEQRPPFSISDDGRDADGHKPVVITILARHIVVISGIRIDAYASQDEYGFLESARARLHSFSPPDAVRSLRVRNVLPRKQER